MPPEIWAVVAVTLVGAYGAAALNLAARRQRERAATKRGFDRGARGHAACGRRAARVGPTLSVGVGSGSRRHCRHTSAVIGLPPEHRRGLRPAARGAPFEARA